MIPILYRLAWLVPSRDAIRDRVALVYRLACAEWRADRLRNQLDQLRRDHDRLRAERRQKPPRPYVTDTDQEQETPAA